MSKIFRVEVTFDVWVEAEDKKEAGEIARKNMKGELSWNSDYICDIDPHEVTGNVEKDVADSLPYRSKKGPNETIGQILARNATQNS